MIHMRTRAAFVLELILCGTSTVAQEKPAVKLEVDLRDAAKRIYHARMEFPVTAGPLTLVYPKWIPGETRSEWADRGCNRIALSRGRKRDWMAAGSGGSVRISLRNSGRSNNAGGDAGLFVAGGRRNSGPGFGKRESGGAAVEFGGAVSCGREIGRREICGQREGARGLEVCDCAATGSGRGPNGWSRGVRNGFADDAGGFASFGWGVFLERMTCHPDKNRSTG